MRTKNATDQINLGVFGMKLGINGYWEAKEEANDDVEMRNKNKLKFDVKAHQVRIEKLPRGKVRLQ